MLLLIDNYDSFTYNLVHYLNELGAETHVVRNDALGVREALGMQPQGVLLSPGPKTPKPRGCTLPAPRMRIALYEKQQFPPLTRRVACTCRRVP